MEPSGLWTSGKSPVCEYLERGDSWANRGKSGRGGGEGVELPINAILERSQDLEELKYGTSEDNLIVESEYLAPGSPVESTDGMDNNEESESSWNLTT